MHNKLSMLSCFEIPILKIQQPLANPTGFVKGTEGIHMD